MFFGEVPMRNVPVSVAGALMPDAHVGYGLPIGGVLATDNAVIAERLEQAKTRHLAEVADHRRHRHVHEQCFPNSNFVEPLRRNRFTRQIELVNELHDFDDIRRTLHALEGFDELR
jgi:hypothetical protein